MSEKTEDLLYRYENAGMEIKIFMDGKYTIETENQGDVGNLFHYEKFVSESMNKLRAQIFNLLEASVTNEKQCNALKGLIKGFSYENQNDIVENIGDILLRLGIVRCVPRTTEN